MNRTPTEKGNSYTIKVLYKKEGIMEKVIVIQDLEKVYPKNVTEVSLSVNNGEILGLIGPNGAGKTICVSVLAIFITSVCLYFK
jgi:ABC-type branched-subunit amino acid transport system ATPase component